MCCEISALIKASQLPGSKRIIGVAQAHSQSRPLVQVDAGAEIPGVTDTASFGASRRADC